MKFFLILFGLATIFGSFLIMLFANTYERGISFALKLSLGIILFGMGAYLIHQGIQEFKSKKPLD